MLPDQIINDQISPMVDRYGIKAILTYLALRVGKLANQHQDQDQGDQLKQVQKLIIATLQLATIKALPVPDQWQVDPVDRSADRQTINDLIDQYGVGQFILALSNIAWAIADHISSIDQNDRMVIQFKQGARSLDRLQGRIDQLLGVP